MKEHEAHGITTKTKKSIFAPISAGVPDAPGNKFLKKSEFVKNRKVLNAAREAAGDAYKRIMSGDLGYEATSVMVAMARRVEKTKAELVKTKASLEGAVEKSKEDPKSSKLDEQVDRLEVDVANAEKRLKKAEDAFEAEKAATSEEKEAEKAPVKKEEKTAEKPEVEKAKGNPTKPDTKTSKK